ncbi:MAG TPA: hypothetical protein VEB21_17730, partial [Terriglobales bacterium]|nr:hypothetical protein [Terriglobales bacterium]
MRIPRVVSILAPILSVALVPAAAFASEADLVMPDLSQVSFVGIDGWSLLFWMGLVVCSLGFVFGIVQFVQLRNLPVHRSMRDISELIYETCKTYLLTQMRFIGVLWLFIGT